jgi:hypothetical protein
MKWYNIFRPKVLCVKTNLQQYVQFIPPINLLCTSFVLSVDECLSFKSVTPNLFVAGGHLTLVGPINAFIHIVMYAYYFATAMWPEYKNILWWKERLTQMQMVMSYFRQRTCHRSGG